MLRTAVLLGLLGGFAFAPNTAFAQQSTTASLQHLIQEAQREASEGNARQAFERLRQEEQRFAGRVQFDYWYGVVGLRAGEINEAIMALERAIANNPNHAGARLELAGAYIRGGNLDGAEEQLNHLETLDAPARAQEAMGRYREMIAERRARLERGQQVLMLGMEMGYDSNFLNYPSSFDLFANTFLQGIAVLEADSTLYGSLRGAWWKRNDHANDLFSEISVSGQSRTNRSPEARQLDTDVLQGSYMLGHQASEHTDIKLGLELGKVWLDGDGFRDHMGFVLNYTRRLDQFGDGPAQIAYNIRFREFDFENDRSDYNAWQGEIDFSNQLNDRVRLRSRISAERELAADTEQRPGGNAIRQLVMVGFDVNLSPQWQVKPSLAYNRVKYSNPDFMIFNHGEDVIRDDDGFTSRIEIVRRASNYLQMSLAVQYREQTSTVEFFNLDQTLVQWSLNYAY